MTATREENVQTAVSKMHLQGGEIMTQQKAVEALNELLESSYTDQTQAAALRIAISVLEGHCAKGHFFGLSSNTCIRCGASK